MSNPLHLINLWLIIRCVHSNQSQSVEPTHNYPTVANPLHLHLSNVLLSPDVTDPINLSNPLTTNCPTETNSDGHPFTCPTYPTLGSSSKDQSIPPLQPFGSSSHAPTPINLLLILTHHHRYQPIPLTNLSLIVKKGSISSTKSTYPNTPRPMQPMQPIQSTSLSNLCRVIRCIRSHNLPYATNPFHFLNLSTSWLIVRCD